MKYKKIRDFISETHANLPLALEQSAIESAKKGEEVKVIVALILYDQLLSATIRDTWPRGSSCDRALMAVNHICKESDTVSLSRLEHAYTKPDNITVPVKSVMLIEGVAITIENIPSDEIGVHSAILKLSNSFASSCQTANIELKELHVNAKVVKSLPKKDLILEGFMKKYNASNLYNKIARTLCSPIINDKDSKKFELPYRSIEFSVFPEIVKHNSMSVKKNVIEGKSVFCRPMNKEGVIAKVLDGGDLVIKFDFPVTKGHSLDGREPTGTCITTDESSIDIKNDEKILNMTIPVI